VLFQSKTYTEIGVLISGNTVVELTLHTKTDIGLGNPGFRRITVTF